MMRGLIIAGLVALSAGAASAQCVKPEQAAALTGKQAFTQTRTLKGLSKPLVSEGDVEAVGDSVIWRVAKPVSIVTKVSPKGITQSVEGGPDEPVGPAGGASNPFMTETGLGDLLRGDLSTMEQRYTVDRAKRAKPEGWSLTMKPKAKSLSPYIASIVAEGCKRVESITVSQPNGDRIRIDLKASN